MLQGGVLFLALHSNLFLSFVNAKERFLVSSILISARDVSLILATVACVVVFDGGLVGAVLAAALAELVLLIGSFGAIGRVDLRLRLAWNPSFLAGALPIGLGFSLTYVFIVMAQRLDQLIVYQLEGPAPAGLYSVALTVSQLTAYAAGAISLTSFPRIADLDDDAVAALIERVARLAAASAVLAGALVALAAPLGMRVAFGDAYGPAAAPTLLLVVGAIVYSQQIALARGAAARGRVRVLVVSFAINVLLMTGLAYVLIPTFGLQGAALASIGGSVAGYLVCLRAFGRSSPLNLPFRKLVPTPADFGEVLSKLGSLVQSRKPGRN
jgi:O-antigen/teichoic acid export membrane protein